MLLTRNFRAFHIGCQKTVGKNDGHFVNQFLVPVDACNYKILSCIYDDAIYKDDAPFVKHKTAKMYENILQGR